MSAARSQLLLAHVKFLRRLERDHIASANRYPRQAETYLWSARRARKDAHSYLDWAKAERDCEDESLQTMAWEALRQARRERFAA